MSENSSGGVLRFPNVGEREAEHNMETQVKVLAESGQVKAISILPSSTIRLKCNSKFAGVMRLVF